MNGLVKKPYAVYFFAGFISIILSAYSNMQEWVINPDAICYLQSAATLHRGLHTAMNLCGQAKWPFYSILIAICANITKLSYLHAAYFLNSIFSMMSVVIFVGIIAILTNLKGTTNDYLSGPRRRQLLWWAAFVILLAPEFNAVRQYIIRDHGYWAFYLLSLFFLLQFVQQGRWYFAWGWSGALLIATLFRIEGFIFLVGGPLVVLFARQQSWLTRLYRFFQLNTLNIILGIFIFSWFFLHPKDLHTYKRLEDLQFQFTHGLHFIAQRYYWQGNALTHSVLGHGTPGTGAYLLLVTLFVWYLTTVISNLSITYTLLIIYAWWNKKLPPVKIFNQTLMGYVLVNILITWIFLGENMFLSKRYVIALLLIFMLWVPFALETLTNKWHPRKLPTILIITIIFIFSSGGIFHFGYSKKYIYEAGHWLAEKVPPHAKIYSNDFQVMYYSNHFGNQIFEARKKLIDPGPQKLFKNNSWHQYDYIALRLTKNDPENNFKLLKKIKWRPLQVFKNRRGDKVVIYCTKKLTYHVKSPNEYSRALAHKKVPRKD